MESETNIDLKTERGSDGEMQREIDLLYAEHEIKEEMVIGPVVLQRAAYTNNTNRSKDAPLLKEPRLEMENATPNQAKPHKEIKGNYSEEITSNVDLNKNTSTDIKTREVKNEGPTNTYKQRKHDQSSTIPNIFICNDCGKYFKNKWAFAAHIEDHKDIKQDNNWSIHLRVQKGEKTYSHCFCEYKCQKKSCLTTNLRINTEPYSVSFCKYKSTRENNLTKDVMIHTDEKSYSCSFCEYKCVHKSKLTRHLRIHTGERPYSCSFCDYKCIRKVTLTHHLRIHTGEKPYSCSFCEYKSARKTDLKYHIRTHTGEKPYSCSFCEYKSARQTCLRNHLRTHTGEKPYSCSFCEYKCTQKISLINHLRIHTGEKPYSCSLCDYKFTRKSYLTNHLRIHSIEKPSSSSSSVVSPVDRTSATF